METKVVEQPKQEAVGAEADDWRSSKPADRRKSTDCQQQDKRGKPRHKNSRQKSFEASNNDPSAANSSSSTAKERRQAYNHRTSSSKQSNDRYSNAAASNNATNTNSRRGSKSRSMSITNQGDQQQLGERDESVENGSANAKKRANRGSTTSNGKGGRLGSHSINSNGESFDYEDMELDEPFTDSDEESPRRHQVQKPCLIIPRGRIRTLSGTVPPLGRSPKWGGPTMCLSCLQFFNLPEEIGKFAEHLLEEHRIVVEEVDLIVDPKRYIEHWRQRFAKESVDKVFPKKVPIEGDAFFGKVDYYYEMSERLPEDYSLRQRLAMRRLEEALGCQQREREEVTFSMQCIFCRYVARGNRSKLIHHLYMIHHLNLGSPDNLVFVSEYIEHLKEKLQRNECIYCEKTFSDRTVLMDHMRKRNHREVNPKNNYYDKFYIINYLELGKRWLDVLAEDFEDTMPTFADSDDEEEEESWHEWQEDNNDEDQLRSVCLFCERSDDKIEEMVKHMSEAHAFDFVAFVEKEQLDVYGRMKFLNFVRKQTFNTPQYRAKSRASCGSAGDANDNSSNNENKPGSPTTTTTTATTPSSTSASPPTAVSLPERAQWETEENLCPMFGNDHLPWMLESYLEHLQKGEKEEVGEPEECGAVRKSKSVSESVDIDPQQMEAVLKTCLEESKKNTVQDVVAEDWPDLKASVLAEQELCKSLR